MINVVMMLKYQASCLFYIRFGHLKTFVTEKCSLVLFLNNTQYVSKDMYLLCLPLVDTLPQYINYPIFTYILTVFVLSRLLSKISEEIKLCEAGECSYLRPQRRSILKDIIVSKPAIHCNCYYSISND